MKHGMWVPMLALGILGLGSHLTGCGPKPTPRTGLFLDINPNSLEQVDRDGVRISVKAITLENYSSFPKVYTALAAETPTGPTTIPWIDISIPAFELTILNSTAHVLKLTRTVVKLQDDRGTIYEPSTRIGLDAMVDTRAQKLAADQVRIDIAEARGRIKTLKLLDPDLELLPEIAEVVYVAFDYPEEPATFLEGKHSLRLMLYEIPVMTDEAGEVTRTANFEFLYDVSTRAIGGAR